MSTARHAPFLSLAALGIALASGLGWLVLSGPAMLPAPEAQPAQPDGKISDRLSFVEEDVPVRLTRIYDTLAMFSMTASEAQPWSERRVPTLAALDAGPGAAKAKAPTMPRMVVAERAPPRNQALPPSRPTQLAAAATAPIVPVRAAAPTAPAEPSREPVRLFGWGVPGSQYLPGRRDAVKTAELIGTQAAKVGSGTAAFATDAASAVGDTVSSVGSTVAETVGWR